MRKAVFDSLVLVLGLSLSWLSQAQPSAEELARLEKGKILVHSEKDAETGEQVAVGRVIFLAPIETAWEVITDYLSYPQFLSDVREVKIEKKNGNQTLLRMKLKNLWPFPDYELLVQVEEFKENRAVKFQMKEGDFARYYGSWKLTPLKAVGEDKTRTLAEYRFYQYIGWWWFPIIPKTLSNNSIVSERLNDFRKRIREVQIENSLEPEKVIQPFWKKSIFKDRKKESGEKNQEKPTANPEEQKK